MQQTFSGKVAVITGAGRGIGRATALLLAAQGAAVVVNDTGVAVDGAGGSEQPARETTADIVRGGGRALANFEDVAAWDGAQRLIASALQDYGQIDILVNNAGLGDGTPLWQIDAARFARVVGASLNGTFNCTRHVMLHMMGRKAGHIVNFLSRAGLVGISSTAAYGAAKGGVYGFTNVAARELAPFGVRMNGIVPAATRTRMVTEGINVPGRDQARLERDARILAAMQEPEQVAPVVAFLCSEACTFTGQYFLADGESIGRFPALTPTRQKKPGPGPWTADSIAKVIAALGADVHTEIY